MFVQLMSRHMVWSGSNINKKACALILHTTSTTSLSLATQIFPYLLQIQKITLKVWKVHVLWLKHMEVSFSSTCSSASRKTCSSEFTASSVKCVTVSDTDVSVPPRKKTELSTKLTRISWISELVHILLFFL